MTVEESMNDISEPSEKPDGPGATRIFMWVAAAFLVLGLIDATIAALQLVVPDLLPSNALLTYGRVAPASRLLLGGGWATVALLAASLHVVSRITGSGKARSALALIGLSIVSAGVLAGTIGIYVGLQSGLAGQEAPLWARAILAIGLLLTAVAISGTAKAQGDALGAAGWYLTAGPIILAGSALVGLVPVGDGIPANIVAAFVNASFTTFFVATSVGLLYFVFASLTNNDPTATRPLSALGFWSLILVWAHLGAVELIYSPAPDWYETLAVAFAISALVPLLTIATDLGLMVKGLLGDIGDRASLRYAVVASLSLAAATVGTIALAWRGTSALVQFSTWVNGVDALVLFGGVSFAVFATMSVLRGGSTKRSIHYTASSVGLTLMVLGFLIGGAAVGFSWAAGPASQSYANLGPAWKITADTLAPFLWLAAIGTVLYLVAQVLWVFSLRKATGEELTTSGEPFDYELELEGAARYANWKRLRFGVAGVWLLALLLTAVLPVLDDTDRDATLRADYERTYDAGTAEAKGRSLFISEGCTECHTQQVRAIGTDVGLGPVSVAGDYANESPALLGHYRVGPDLMHYGGNTEFFDKVLVTAHIQDPRSLGLDYSSMPSYSYLSSDDIAALVSYMESLR